MLFRAAWARQALPRQALPRRAAAAALPFQRQAFARTVTTDAASAHAENVPQVSKKKKKNQKVPKDVQLCIAVL